MVADFWTDDVGPVEGQANAEHYAAMMNRLLPVEDDGA